MTGILIIESTTIDHSFTKLLDNSEFNILTAIDMADAIEQLQNNVVNFIIVTKKHEELTNFQNFNTLCASAAAKSIPLLLLPAEMQLISDIAKIINMLVLTKNNAGSPALLDTVQTKKQISQRVARLALTAQACSLREMVSIMSHELSQPLMIIRAYISGCLHRLKNSTIDKEHLIDAMNKSNQNVDLAGQLLHRMKNQIRKAELIYEVVNLHALIQRAVDLTSPDPSFPPIDIQYQFDENLPLIEIDMTKIKLVLVNLLNNGIEALQEAKIEQPVIIIKTETLDESTIAFYIQDNGAAIPEHTIQNDLFNSCLSEKKTGLGMGLATCRGIIDDHHGIIEYHALPETGSCFKINLPIKASHY